jgi:hypothetical protein
MKNKGVSGGDSSPPDGMKDLSQLLSAGGTAAERGCFENEQARCQGSRKENW